MAVETFKNGINDMSANGFRILVAEDDEITRTIVEHTLAAWGYEVVSCVDGQEAWEILRGDDPPRLAVIDWMMPGMDGLELCRAVRHKGSDPYIYLLLVTSRHLKTDVVKGLDAGADDYVTKPIQLDELNLRLRTGRRLLDLQAELKAEHEKSDRLLLNVLPEPIANRLKTEESTIADAFADVTVLFADIVGFTPLSARMAPADTLSMLGEIFSSFDKLADRHGVEKIKTIGDAYMVAGGVPVVRPDHATAVADMALDMLDVIRAFSREAHQPLQMRIGMHCGPLVAGVIGRKRFIYDLWGDTVNTASRMESHGLPDSIHCTAELYERLRGRYVLEGRGEIDIKGKGPMTTYLLKSRR